MVFNDDDGVGDCVLEPASVEGVRQLLCANLLCDHTAGGVKYRQVQNGGAVAAVGRLHGRARQNERARVRDVMD